MIDVDNGLVEQRSSVCLERTAKGVIVPRVKVYVHDADPATLDVALEQAKRVFEDALAYAADKGERP